MENQWLWFNPWISLCRRPSWIHLELCILPYRLKLLIRRNKSQNHPKMYHKKFISRTLLVRNGDVDEAVRLVNKLMGKEGFFDQYRRTRYYEKPCQYRLRINYEKCKSLYDEDMARKIQFILRKNRTDPFPGCF